MLFRTLVPLSHIRNNRLRYRDTAMASTTQAGSAAAPPWHASYPAPKTEAGAISRDEVLSLLNDPKSIPGKDFVLVDLRRADHEGGTIRGSINLPAQSLWPTIPTIYAMFKAAGLRKVIWYCGSSRGRGTRAAGWFADYIADKADGDMESLVLSEGIRGWASAGGEFVRWMDEFDDNVWSKGKD